MKPPSPNVHGSWLDELSGLQSSLVNEREAQRLAIAEMFIKAGAKPFTLGTASPHCCRREVATVVWHRNFPVEATPFEKAFIEAC